MFVSVAAIGFGHAFARYANIRWATVVDNVLLFVVVLFSHVFISTHSHSELFRQREKR